MAKAQRKKIIVKPNPESKKPLGEKLTFKKLVPPTIPIKRLLARSEGLQVDFKRDAESVKPDDLVAFANGGGGTILIGVDEIRGANGIQRGKVVGCDVSDKERNKIVSRANSCRPAIPVTVTVEANRKQALMRVDIQEGGLHCTSNGTYKIHRDGQNDIIDPVLMAEIIVRLERARILGYLRAAVRPEIEDAQDDMQTLYDEAQAEIEDLRAELEDARNHMDYEHDY